MPSLKNRTALRRPRTDVRNSAVSFSVSSTPTARNPRSNSVGSMPAVTARIGRRRLVGRPEFSSLTIMVW